MSEFLKKRYADGYEEPRAKKPKKTQLGPDGKPLSPFECFLENLGKINAFVNKLTLTPASFDQAIANMCKRPDVTFQPIDIVEVNTDIQVATMNIYIRNSAGHRIYTLGCKRHECSIEFGDDSLHTLFLTKLMSADAVPFSDDELMNKYYLVL